MANKRKGKEKNKFSFGTDFQQLILQYTVTENKGFKALELYDDSYFSLIPHSVIAYALKKYYKKRKNIPELPYLREFLRELYNGDSTFRYELTPDDKKSVEDILSAIYSRKVSNPDLILESCINFSRYVSFKNELENIDITNYDSYASAITKLQKANSKGFELQENYGTFIVGGMKDRAHKRDLDYMSCPTPFWQMNKLLNSGGTEKGNVITILSKEKFFKTGALINIARGYMKMRKRGFYADLENGEVTITVRTEQSISNQDQDVIKSGDWDNNLLKLFRKYQRIGAEMVVKKFPNLQTNCGHIQKWLDDLRRDFGITFDFGIIDYGLLLGAVSGKTDDFNRISDAFLDMKNLAAANNLDALWTAAHTTREANKRVGTKFVSTDIAKCIDIPKHIDALLGLQQDDDEAKSGVMRLEVIEQRNGMRDGKMLFWVDIPKQRMKEFTKAEVKEYYRQLGDTNHEDRPVHKKGKSSDL